MFFCITAPARTRIYALSLHDALPILWESAEQVLESESAEQASVSALAVRASAWESAGPALVWESAGPALVRSEEHTSELQSRPHLVCRLLLEKKNGNCMPQIHDDDSA